MLKSLMTPASDTLKRVTEPAQPRLAESLQVPCPGYDPARVHHIGIFLGEGVGTEVVPIAMSLLDVLAKATSRRFELHEGGLIGLPAKAIHGSSLSEEVASFADEVFAKGGALFCGPGGDRFVYEIRQRFDLYCKFTPLRPLPETREAGSVRAETVARADIVAVRENMGGIYQGVWEEEGSRGGGRVARHRFEYHEDMVCRIMGVALRLAATRRGKVHVVLKPGGIPSISSLWRECATELARGSGIALGELEIDNAVFQLIADPGQFDVIVSPNMFGDVLADCGSLLLASRGLSYSGNFNDAGNGVYQTGHGAARDIAGKDVANPIGQILSLGMMLRESFCCPEADAALRQAVRETLRQGKCTGDIAMPGHEVVGTAEFGRLVKANLERLLADVDA
jgi:3-isopropylmalate dehydrogenase